jgi:hypothetical protein
MPASSPITIAKLASRQSQLPGTRIGSNDLITIAHLNDLNEAQRLNGLNN